jgi:hypothetical protein
MAELPDDISPFQIGTNGVYKGLRFSIVGRLKIAWADGCWNEWFIYFDDAKKAWLAEAQGSLAIIFEEYLPQGEVESKFGKMPKLKSQIKIAGVSYRVCDIKECECVGSEGELPFAAPKGRKTQAVDLIAGNNRFAGIEYSQDEPPTVFTGHYVEFDELEFSNLRELEGWTMPSRNRKGKKA